MDKVVKILLWTILVLFVAGMGVQIASGAEATHQYIKQYMEPLYRQSMIQNTDYQYTLILDTPDGISKVVSAMLTMQVWHNPTVNYYVWVNGQVCNTETFQVHTTYANAGEGTIYFDCSNIITKEGIYNVTFRTDDDVGASTFWADITYSNRPRADISVHGTEYIVGDPAKIWLQLLNSTGDYVNDGVCYTDVYTPDNSEYLERALMINQNHDGIYYYDLTAPFQTGVYPVIARCYYTAVTEIDFATSYAVYEGDSGGEPVSNTWIDDDDKVRVKTDDTIYPFKRLDFNFTFADYYDECGDVDESLMSGISFLWKGKWNTGTANHDVIIYVWNYTSSEWVELSNDIPGGLGGTIQTITNTIETNNITKALGITATNEMKIRLFDTPIDEGGKDFDTYYLYAGCDQLADPEWQEVKGSSEMHVTAPEYWQTEVFNGEISNASWPGNFTYTFNIQSLTVVNRTEEVYIDLPTPFACAYYLSGEVEGVPIDLVSLSNPLNPLSAGCQVTFLANLTPGINYNAELIFENNFKEIEQSWVTKNQWDYEILRIACDNYNVANGLPNYTIPATEPLDYTENDAMWRLCQQYQDQFYDWNYTYFEMFQTPSGNFSVSDMQFLDNEWAHLVLVNANLEEMAQNLMNGLQTGHDYSGAIIANPTGQPIPYYATYWANNSMSWINYQLLAALTSGAVNVSVNTTGIADAVWGYAGTPATALLNLISANMWSYTTRTLTAFNLWQHETAATYVWNDSNRTLTEAPFDPDLIATAVWNSATRNLTSFDFVVDANVDWELGALYIWNATTRGLTEAVNANVDWATGALYNWNATTRELTAIQWDHENAALYTWNSTTRELTTAPFNPDTIANATWNYANRSLTEFDFTVNTTVDYTSIGEYVWNTTTRGLTENTNPNIDWTTGALFVWNSTTRELTSAPVDLASIANATWEWDARYTHGIVLS